MAGDNSFRTTNNLQKSEYFESVKAGALLSNSVKANLSVPERAAKTARFQIDPYVDLGKLDVCFGGFSPTAMNSNGSSSAMVDAAMAHQTEVQAAKKRAAEIELARASEAKEFNDADTIWNYVVLDDREIKIIGCSTSEQTLIIPSEIDGLPVTSIAQDGCAFLDSVEKIIISDNVIQIGACAFRNCSHLKHIEFPLHLINFDTNWIRQCDKIERIKLPGEIDKITSALFEFKNLKKLCIGSALKNIPPGTFANSHLESIEIDGNNPYVWTDGLAVYTKDRTVLVALGVPCEKYSVIDECLAVARKGFSAFESLREIELPDGLVVIGPFAFTRTGIDTFTAPSSLKAIGERAFFACKDLCEVALNEGIESIGLEAFADTAITSLTLPSSIRDLEYPLASGTTLTYSGANATFSIDRSEDDTSGSLMLDENGGLYQYGDEGITLIKMMDPDCVSYDVMSGTTVISSGAFLKHAKITSIHLPDSIVEIADVACKSAKSLTEINIPLNCERIGEEAFLDTALQRISIPAKLVRIGSAALITQGSHHGDVEPSLRKIEVDADNPRFYMSDGLLIERLDNGAERIILCTCEFEDIVIPSSVSNIAMYAFNGARRIRTLTLSDKIAAIDVRGLGFDCLIDRIHVDLIEPIEGHDSFDFHFPKTARAMQQMRLSFGSANYVNVASIFDHYDASITNRNGFEGLDQQLNAYDQVNRIIERLNDPVFMTAANRNLMTITLRNHLRDFCLDAARHDDKSIMTALLELGFIDEDNISDVIEWVGAVQDASVTNYLLDEKRRRFGSQTIDFEL